MAKTRQRKKDQSGSTAHLEPHVFTDQAEAEAAAEAHAQEQARCDVWETTPRGGRSAGWCGSSGTLSATTCTKTAALSAKKGGPMTDLQRARAAAAQRYAQLGRVLLEEVGLSPNQVQPSSGLNGRVTSLLGAVFIVAPWPTTTRKRLYILAHECGHVHHAHGRRGTPRKPRHREEYEAESYAHAALRRHGVAVPQDMTARARRYVARKIYQALKRGAKPANIDREALRFARAAWPPPTP